MPGSAPPRFAGNVAALDGTIVFGNAASRASNDGRSWEAVGVSGAMRRECAAGPPRGGRVSGHA